MLLVLFDSFQITFMRSALLAMRNYGAISGAAEIVNLLSSVVVVAGYCLIAVIATKNASDYLLKVSSEPKELPEAAPTTTDTKPKATAETSRYFEEFFRGYRRYQTTDQTGFTDKYLGLVPGLFVLKNLLFQICLIFGTDAGIGQLIGFVSLDVTALVIHFIFRPQSSMVGFIFQTGQISSEVFVSLSLAVAQSLDSTISFEAQQQYFGPTMMFFFSVVIGCSAILMISETSKGILQLFRSQKGKVMPAPVQDPTPIQNPEATPLNEKKPKPADTPVQRKNSTVTTKSGTTTVKYPQKASKPAQPAKVQQQQIPQNKRPPQVPMKVHPGGQPAPSPVQKMVPAKQILPQQSNPPRPLQQPSPIQAVKPKVNAYTSLLKPIPIWPGSPQASVFSPGPGR